MALHKLCKFFRRKHAIINRIVCAGSTRYQKHYGGTNPNRLTTTSDIFGPFQFELLVSRRSRLPPLLALSWLPQYMLSVSARGGRCVQIVGTEHGVPWSARGARSEARKPCFGFLHGKRGGMMTGRGQEVNRRLGSSSLL